MHTRRFIAAFLAASTALALLAGTLASVGVAHADTAPGCSGDTCVLPPDTVQTPLGVVTITADAASVVTVHLVPTVANTLVIGIPFSVPEPQCALPPGPPCLVRTSIDTLGGTVTIDTVQITRSRFALPSLAIVSIHPPNPCRVRTSGTTVVFTPIG